MPKPASNLPKNAQPHTETAFDECNENLHTKIKKTINANTWGITAKHFTREKAFRTRLTKKLKKKKKLHTLIKRFPEKPERIVRERSWRAERLRATEAWERLP